MDLTEFQLRHLGPEPWGKRLTRAREDAGYTMREVEDALRPHVSRTSIARLEDLDSVPSKPADRGRALMMLVFFGMDPNDFGLGPDDVPPLISLGDLYELGIRTGRFATALVGPWNPGLGVAA